MHHFLEKKVLEQDILQLIDDQHNIFASEPLINNANIKPRWFSTDGQKIYKDVSIKKM